MSRAGLPRSSARQWILHVRPPRERPIASSDSPFFELAAERCAFTWLLSIDSSSGIGPAAAILSNSRCQVLARRKVEAPQSDSEPIEAAVAIGYSAAAVAENAGILNRAFCSSLSVA